jgi:hypothetical protein
MADGKISAATLVSAFADAYEFPVNDGTTTRRKANGTLLRSYLGNYAGAGSPEGAVTANVGDIYRDTTNGDFYEKRSGAATNTGWQMIGYPRVTNQNTANQSPAANATTYITGSALAVPLTGLKAATRFYWAIGATKTAAGTAANSIDVRIGTAASTADTSRLSFSLGAGTAIADNALIEIWAQMRTVGSGTTAVIAGMCKAGHNLSTTGWFVIPVVSPTPIASAGFDSTVASLKVGLSLTTGASMAATIVTVQSTMEGL